MHRSALQPEPDRAGNATSRRAARSASRHRRTRYSHTSRIGMNRLLVLSVVCITAIAGCARKAPQLRVYPEQSLPFVQKFPRSYLSISEAGDYEIVMVSEGRENTRKQGK